MISEIIYTKCMHKPVRVLYIYKISRQVWKKKQYCDRSTDPHQFDINYKCYKLTHDIPYKNRQNIEYIKYMKILVWAGIVWIQFFIMYLLFGGELSCTSIVILSRIKYHRHLERSAAESRDLGTEHMWEEPQIPRLRSE